MRNESGVPLEPTFHLGMFVSSIVVHDHMEFQPAGKFFVQVLKKLHKLLMAMPGITLFDDFTCGDFERCKECGRSIINS